MAAFTVITAAQVDAKSPLSDELMEAIRHDLDFLQSTLVDGASAAQSIVTNKVDIRSTASDAFNNDGQMQQDGDAQFDSAVNIDGTLTVGAFNRADDLIMYSGY